MKTQEADAIAALIAQGYKVEVIDPHASAFNQKYYVYKDTEIGKRSVLTDEHGNVTGHQG